MNTLVFEFMICIKDYNKINCIFKELYEIIYSNYNKQFTIKLCFNKKRPIKLFFFIKLYNINYKNKFNYLDYYEFKLNLQKYITNSLEKFIWKSEDTSDEEQEYLINLKYIYPFENISFLKYSYIYNLSYL
jgi:hypothetical protein